MKNFRGNEPSRRALQKSVRFLLLFGILLTAAIWTRRRTVEFAAAPYNRVQFDEIPAAEVHVLDLRRDGELLNDVAYADTIDPNFGRTFAMRISG
jgi:hypothetical protein